MRQRCALAPLLATCALVAGCAATAADLGMLDEPAARGPASPTLGAPPPALDDRTVVLFDGTAWRGWHQRDGKPSAWRVEADGTVTVAGGDAITDAEFGDFQLHVEFRCPPMRDRAGQARANSGVYLHGRYEVQVLDSFGDAPANNGCGAVYSIATPLVNASSAPGSFQTYDIVFRAPRLAEATDDALIPGEASPVTEPARMTVIHNGVVIHNNLVLPHATPGGLDDQVVARGPLLLQDHGDPIQYRNIWLRRLDP
jgi:hypothetical protein